MLAHTERRRRARDRHGVDRPVDTHLLLRGITRSQALEGPFAREIWRSWWRPLESVGTDGVRAPSPEEARLLGDSNDIGAEEGLCGSGVPADLVRRAPTAGEALLFALVAAVKATHATAALLHRVREPFVGLVTSSTHGPEGTEAELGQVISRHDAALAVAQRREMVMGSKDVGGPERAIARRFSACGAELQAVAMVPVFDGEMLLAMLEVGRVDHVFRAGDEDVLRAIAATVSAR